MGFGGEPPGGGGGAGGHRGSFSVEAPQPDPCDFKDNGSWVSIPGRKVLNLGFGACFLASENCPNPLRPHLQLA